MRSHCRSPCCFRSCHALPLATCTACVQSSSLWAGTPRSRSTCSPRVPTSSASYCGPRATACSSTTSLARRGCALTYTATERTRPRCKPPRRRRLWTCASSAGATTATSRSTRTRSSSTPARPRCSPPPRPRRSPWVSSWVAHVAPGELPWYLSAAGVASVASPLGLAAGHVAARGVTVAHHRHCSATVPSASEPAVSASQVSSP